MTFYGKYFRSPLHTRRKKIHGLLDIRRKGFDAHSYRSKQIYFILERDNVHIVQVFSSELRLLKEKNFSMPTHGFFIFLMPTL